MEHGARLVGEDVGFGGGLDVGKRRPKGVADYQGGLASVVGPPRQVVTHGSLRFW